MVSYKELLPLCNKYTMDGYYAGESIPDKKLANARKHFQIPVQEPVAAVLDTTVFRSGKNGLAIAETGLYSRDANSGRRYLPWSELSSLTVTYESGNVANSIKIEEAEILLVARGGLASKLVNLLSEIQHLVRSTSTNNSRERWMLAVNGSQYGPYDLPTVRAMVAERQIDPETCLVWREGMPNWTPFERVPDLAALLRDAAPQSTIAPPPLPPPPLPSSATPTATNPQVRDEDTKESPYRSAERTRGKAPSSVDLNHAPLDDLLALPGMTMLNGPKLVRERSRRGGFGTVEEVGRFLELPPHQVERLKEQSFVSTSEGTGPRDRRVVDF